MENTELEMFNSTVIYGENDTIFIHPLCDLFGLNYQHQTRIIKKDHILCEEWRKKSSPDLFKDGQNRYCLTKNGFLRWVEIQNPNIIKTELQNDFKFYQKSVIDYLYGKSLTPNIKRQYEIDCRLKELNSVINKAMVEHRQLELERKQITKQNYDQLGLKFPEDNEELLEKLKPFHQKELV